ncbi:MAG: helix-turn-helix domain-containing protein [Candidatus Omnitrophota bacterium]
MNPTYRNWLTISEAGDYLQKSKKSIYNLVHLKRIPYSKLGASLRFSQEDLDSFLVKNTVQPLKRENISLQDRREK